MVNIIIVLAILFVAVMLTLDFWVDIYTGFRDGKKKSAYNKAQEEQIKYYMESPRTDELIKLMKSQSPNSEIRSFEVDNGTVKFGFTHEKYYNNDYPHIIMFHLLGWEHISDTRAFAKAICRKLGSDYEIDEIYGTKGKKKSPKIKYKKEKQKNKPRW